MKPRRPQRPRVMKAPEAGLCDRCAHVRRIESGRGSTFYLCERAKTDPRLRKYPQLPVLRCVGFEEERVN